jgi:hypothetical protein
VCQSVYEGVAAAFGEERVSLEVSSMSTGPKMDTNFGLRVPPPPTCFDPYRLAVDNMTLRSPT